LEYDTIPPAKYSDDPAIRVSRPAISPPVHDSATAAQRPRSSSAT
jgi:hypothetical protein